jgi:tetratricopeptide (TPR) repeat protein
MNYRDDISPSDLERFESYIAHKMKGDEKVNFEKELINDPLLKAKFNEIKNIIEGIEKIEFKNKLEQIHREMDVGKDRPGNKFIFNWKYLSVAASVLVIALISIFIFNQPKKNEKLFADYFKSDPGLVTAMSNRDMNYEFERGMIDYKSEKYQSAIDRWEQLLAENIANDTLNYFLGTAYLELKNPEPAITRLKKVTENPQSKFIDEAYWYLALAYILENRTEDAVMVLENTNHPSKEELLKKLGRK